MLPFHFNFCLHFLRLVHLLKSPSNGKLGSIQMITRHNQFVFRTDHNR